MKMVSVELRYGNFSQQNPAKKINEKIEPPVVGLLVGGALS